METRVFQASGTSYKLIAIVFVCTQLMQIQPEKNPSTELGKWAGGPILAEELLDSDYCGQERELIFFNK